MLCKKVKSEHFFVIFITKRVKDICYFKKKLKQQPKDTKGEGDKKFQVNKWSLVETLVVTLPRHRSHLDNTFRKIILLYTAIFHIWLLNYFCQIARLRY